MNRTLMMMALMDDEEFVKFAMCFSLTRKPARDDESEETMHDFRARVIDFLGLPYDV